MANYFSKASFIVNLTREQAIFSVEAASYIKHQGYQNIKGRKDFQYIRDIEKVVSAYRRGSVDLGEECLGFEIELTDEGLWFSHDENIEFENVAVFIQTILAFFKLDDKLEAYRTFIDRRLTAIHSNLQSVGRVNAAAAVDR